MVQTHAAFKVVSLRLTQQIDYPSATVMHSNHRRGGLNE
jgi:hypothetical protein